MQESYFIYDRSSLVKPSFISELNKFLPIYCSVSNFSEKKRKKSKIISAANQKKKIYQKIDGKSELLVQIAKVSGQKIQTMDQKIHNFQLTKTGEKRKERMATIDFISIRGQQNFENDAEINPMEKKIENDRIQNMFEEYKKTLSNSLSKGYFFQALLKIK